MFELFRLAYNLVILLALEISCFLGEGDGIQVKVSVEEGGAAGEGSS